jgi:3-hydroxyacyl-CoA dehydrogenase / enoyl-CoA hydratase / 3-hydroxybutyryl-CoA epimerase
MRKMKPMTQKNQDSAATPNTKSNLEKNSAFQLEPVSSGGVSGLWKLTFDLPNEKVNKFSKKVIEEFQGLIDELERKGKAGEIQVLYLISGKPNNFIAGADIEMINAAKSDQEAYGLSRAGQKLLDRWEDLPFPTLVAIHGTAMGGGCELSLASQYILMSNDPATRIGLPEVLLGIIPGMGGCVRLPRKVGLATALDLILSGRTLTGDKAYKSGLADGVLSKENFEEAVVTFIRTNAEKIRNGVRLAREPKWGGMGGVAGKVLEFTPFGRAFMLKKAREGVMSKTRGNYPAPLEAIDVLRKNGACYGEKLTGKARDESLDCEAHGFGKMAATPESKSLIRLFFMTEVVKKSKGVSSSSGSKMETFLVSRAGVLGAGVMGGGIAQLYADKGITARMKDIASQSLTLGLQSAAKIFKKQLQKRKITERQYQQKMNLIAPTLDYSGFSSAEVVVEAVIEKMEIKKAVLKELEKEISSTCVVASNTSSLSISEMQTSLEKPERFGGMHFFNPVHKMPLVEVIRGAKTSDEAVSKIYQFSKQLGKTPIVVKDAPGFLVNRLLMPYLNEATWLLQEGASIEAIDRELLKFGMPMGPFELIDEVGIDVGEKVAHILFEAFGKRMEPSPFNALVVKAGMLGKKNSKGFYQYEQEGRKKVFSSEIYSILGVTPKDGSPLSKEEIVDRCILPMINEASRCLDDEIVKTPEEVDLGMIMGTGFPPFRGGLLRYADSIGSKEILSRLRRYESKAPERFKPAPRILKMAETGATFFTS